MAKTANEELQDALIRHQIYLLRLSGSIRNRIWNILDSTNEDLADKIRSRLANNDGLSTQVEFRRLQNLMDSIQRIRNPAWQKAEDILKEEIVALSLQESVTIANVVKIVLPVQIDTVMPSARLLRTIALSRPFQGRILSEWAASWEQDDIRRIHSAIQAGMIAGEDMATIANRVTGTDGVIEMSRRQVQAITRTAVMYVSNASRTAWFDDNSDIITQERFVATLDSRTTAICRANDGKLFELGKGPVPPLHFNCRSLRIAVLDGVLAGDRPAKPFIESELVQEYADENDLGDVTSRDDLPHGTKGDFDTWQRGRIRELVGPVPATTTYQEWLKSQSVTFQNDVLGIDKGQLFRKGDLTLDKFVHRNGDELTLGELARKHRDAFIAAGLDPNQY